MNGNFEINIPNVRAAAAQYQEMYQILEDCAARTEQVRKSLGGSSYGDIRSVISSLEAEQKTNMKNLKKMQETLYEIVQCYEQAERNIVGAGEKAIADLAKEKKGLWESIADDFEEDYDGNLKSDLFTSALESGGNTAVKVGGYLNYATAMAKGAGENAFIIVNPNVAATTSKIIQGGKWVSTGAKYGLPLIGGVIDFVTQLAEGEDVGDAAVKSAVHVGVGVAVGAAIGSIIPGPGTIAGAAIGLVIGTVVTTLANSVFDYVYDNWDDVKDYASEKYNQVANAVSDAADNIGDAVSGFFSGLGTVFG